MKAKVIFIEKNFFEKSNQNVIFQLHHIRFTIWEQFLQFKACKYEQIDAISTEVAQQIKLSGCPTKSHFTVKKTFLPLLAVKWLLLSHLYATCQCIGIFLNKFACSKL